MDIAVATPLLGGLTPLAFMRRHWQKKPLLVRGAIPGGIELLKRDALFALAAHDQVESRLIVHDAGKWSLRQGPIPRRALPPLRQSCWTLLVQGLDLHVPAARALLERFRFVPDARLDDAMLSYATDGGGVGPHIDSYDVFLLQAHGRRRWRVGRARSRAFVPGLPLKILAKFEPAHDWLLEPGDMLYLPPGWAHDGVAEGECMTCSIGFRAAGRDELARDVVQRVLDAADADARGPLYRDPAQAATSAPARIPQDLQVFASEAIERLLANREARARALGEVLSEPKRGVWFDARPPRAPSRGVRLDPRTRALYDDRHCYVNGESFHIVGRDARLVRRLADERVLDAAGVAALSPAAGAVLGEWIEEGWVLLTTPGDER